MKINLTPTREKFYTQLNNEIDPYIACQVTSMVAGLDVGGFNLEPIMTANPFKQPEDKLRHFMLNDPDVQNFWKKSHPNNPDVPAPEWGDCMVYAVNKLYGKPITYYDGNITMTKILEDLHKGLPVYTSMKYPDNVNFSGKLSPIPGHIVLIVGVEGDNNLIINDPYKNHLTGERDGFNNRYAVDQFNRHNKGYAIRYRRA